LRQPELSPSAGEANESAAEPRAGRLNEGSVPSLDPALRRRLEQSAATDSPFVLLQQPGSPLAYRLAGPIWAERMVGDALPELGSDAPVETEIELLGFVSLHLDFSSYHPRFLSKLGPASLALLAVLGVSWIIGRFTLKRALSPLAALPAPLVELANGDMDVALPTSRHGEIQSIVSALEDTMVALKE